MRALFEPAKQISFDAKEALAKAQRYEREGNPFIVGRGSRRNERTKITPRVSGHFDKPPDSGGETEMELVGVGAGATGGAGRGAAAIATVAAGGGATGTFLAGAGA